MPSSHTDVVLCGVSDRVTWERERVSVARPTYHIHAIHLRSCGNQSGDHSCEPTLGRKVERCTAKLERRSEVSSIDFAAVKPLCTYLCSCIHGCCDRHGCLGQEEVYNVFMSPFCSLMEWSPAQLVVGRQVQ